MAADPDVDLWALDEVHFQQHGSRCRMWIAPEDSDPIVMHEPTRRSVGYFGAVRLRDGKFIYSRVEDKFNADTFWAFLKMLRKSSSHARKKGPAGTGLRNRSTEDHFHQHLNNWF